MRFTTNRNGFTLVEMLVVITLIGILAAIALPNFLKAKDKAKEAEVKANLHVIQTALERYAVDHRGEFPRVLIGGDEPGWRKCDTIVNRPTDEQPPFDPLLHYDYLSAYPKNPFVNDGLTETIEDTGNPNLLRYGGGDVRFGYDGSTMGNTLADPRYLWDEPGILSRLQYTFATDSLFGANISLEGDYVNPFYTMGGLPDRSGTDPDDRQSRTIKAFWPGQFFYRSTGDLRLRTETDATNLLTIWDANFVSINRYIMGCYGAVRTAGKDVIRLTDVTGEAINNIGGLDDGGTYSNHIIFEDIIFSSPEVFGGGKKGVMPIFPYYDEREQSRHYIYGAPDGYNDGIIMVYTSEMDVANNF